MRQELGLAPVTPQDPVRLGDAPTWTGLHTWTPPANAGVPLTVNGDGLNNILNLVGTSGYVQFTAGGNQLNFTRPGFVYLNSNGAGATFTMQASGSGAVLNFNTGGAVRMAVNATGNVTINAPSSGTALAVSGTLAASSVAVSSGAIPAGGVGINQYTTNVMAFYTSSAQQGKIDAAGNLTWFHAQADSSAVAQTPVTGFSITIANNTSILMLTPAGTLATGTITMPTTPIQGQIIRVCTSQTVTALTVSANAGQTLTGAPTTITPQTGFAYIYNLASTQWIRLN